MQVLLIHPPQAKPAEPPAGIPLLAGALRASGCDCTVCDLNLEGLYFLLESNRPAEDTWSRRSWNSREKNISALRDLKTYRTPDKYKRAVADLNRLLDRNGLLKDITLSIANYQDRHLSPQKSEDLLRAAETFQENIFFPYFSIRLTQLIEKIRPEAVGISLNYLSQALSSFAVIGFLRARFPGLKIILGGGLITTWMQNPGWTDPFCGLVDHSIPGPGEQQLLSCLGLGDSCRRACPDYTDLTDSNYLAPGFILPYATSTGCFWRRCSFCPETSEKNPFLPVSIETVTREVAGLVDRTSPALIHFLDNALSTTVLKAFIDFPPGAPWYGFVRFTRHLADPEFCRRLHASGCIMLKLGLESGSQTVLDDMKKGIDLEVVKKALTALHSAGIMTYVYLLFGTPRESLSEARETLHFVTEFQREITFLNLAIFNLPACSPQTAELDVHDFYEGDLSIYRDFSHPKGWGRKQIRLFLDTEFRRKPAIQRILQNDPLQFTSNHAPFFHPQFSVK